MAAQVLARLRTGSLVFVIAGILRDNGDMAWMVENIQTFLITYNHHVNKGHIREKLDFLVEQGRAVKTGAYYSAIAETVRVKLPQRRPHTSVKSSHNGVNFHVTFGFDVTAQRYTECFCAPSPGMKAGSDFTFLVADACIAISMLLQSGYRFTDLVARFGCNDLEHRTEGPASLLGTICWLGEALDCQDGSGVYQELSTKENGT